MPDRQPTAAAGHAQRVEMAHVDIADVPLFKDFYEIAYREFAARKMTPAQATGALAYTLARVMLDRAAPHLIGDNLSAFSRITRKLMTFVTTGKLPDDDDADRAERGPVN